MNTRRDFFKKLASGLFVAASPQILIPVLNDAFKWKIPSKLKIPCDPSICATWTEADYMLYNRLPFYLVGMEMNRRKAISEQFHKDLRSYLKKREPTLI